MGRDEAIASSWFWPKINFSEEKCHGKFLKEHFWASRFQNFLGGACPQTPLATRAFGARNLPRLLLKSGYGPACTQKTRNGPTSHLGILKGLTVLSKGRLQFSHFFLETQRSRWTVSAFHFHLKLTIFSKFLTSAYNPFLFNFQIINIISVELWIAISCLKRVSNQDLWLM